MVSDQHPAGGLSCSFCGKDQHEVRKFIAGPDVYICDECIGLCNDVLAEEATAEERARAEAAAQQPVEAVEDAVPDWLGTVLRAARRLAVACLEADVAPAIRVRAEDLAKALDRPPRLPGP